MKSKLIYFGKFVCMIEKDIMKWRRKMYMWTKWFFTVSKNS